MSTIKITRFTEFDLTEEERLSAQILTTLQKQQLHNHMAAAAQERLNLEIDFTNHVKFAQQEASLKGQIETYQFLLDLSDAAEQEALSKARQDSGDVDPELYHQPV